MIATIDQARAAIAKLPREKIDALVLGILHAVYGECTTSSTDEDIEVLNSDIEWTQDNIEMVADWIEFNGLTPNQIALP